MPTHSVRFFEAQFQRQVSSGEFELNPFERLALPYLSGEVLDLGCGLGNLAVAAARGKKLAKQVVGSSYVRDDQIVIGQLDGDLPA